MEPRFRGLVFDMDGTLTRPSLDFDAMRRDLGIPHGDIVHAIASLPAAAQARAWAVIEQHEDLAIAAHRLQDGAEGLLAASRAAGLKLGLVTRNTQRSVDALCRKFGLAFDTVLTRAFEFMKPHPGPVLHVLDAWRLPGESVLVIGDYLHDVECGRAAGARTCFFRNPGTPDYGQDADYTVRSMRELEAIVFGGSPRLP